MLSLSAFVSFTSVGRGRPNVWQASRTVTWSSAATVSASLVSFSVRFFTSALSGEEKKKKRNVQIVPTRTHGSQEAGRGQYVI